MGALTDKMTNGQYAAFMIATGAIIGLPAILGFLALTAFGPMMIAVAGGLI